MAYCTNRDLKDIFPSIDEFDTKTALYGFTVDVGSRYIANDVGLVTQLFANGKNLGANESSASNVNANNKWYEFNDPRVETRSEQQLKTPKAYCFFYRKKK